MHYSVLKEKIYNFVSKFNFENGYAVGYRFVNSNEFNISKDIPFSLILPTADEWYADPFPFVFNNKHYIFVEIMNKANNQKGTLGVTCIEDDGGKVHKVLEEDFHLSYPNVFSFKEKIYMIPETGHNNEIRLYECVSFPDLWSQKKVLLSGREYVDTSIYFENDKLLLESLDNVDAGNSFFSLDLDTFELNKLNVIGEFVNRRPGGNFIKYDNGIFHALQNCDGAYGRYLHIAKVEKFNDMCLIEKEIRTIKVSDVSFKKAKGFRFKRVHTFNRCGNLEVIDFYYHRFN